MKGFLAAVQQLGNGLVFIHPLSPTDPGYGQGFPDYRPDNSLPGWERPIDPGYGRPEWGDRPDNSLPGHGRPDNSLPIAPVRPSPPIVLPPVNTWPPMLPPGIDNSLPPGANRPDQPIHIPIDPSIGISQPIYLPQMPAGTAILIALTGGNVSVPNPVGVPPDHAPAILWQGAGTKPVLVYVNVAPVARPK